MGRAISKYISSLLVSIPCMFVVLLAPAVVAADRVIPSIAIIIDDLGNKSRAGEQAVSLPGPVTLSFLPHTPHAKRLAKKAKRVGKEVMLHLPMESEAGNRLGPGGLTLHMTKQLFQQAVWSALDSIPHVAGFNNHMGSLLTRHPGAMSWLMDVAKQHGGLFFVDSRTTGQTVAIKVAFEKELPTATRDVFLDNVRSKKAIRAEFRRLVRVAKKRGYAIGIGHPYPETMAVLKKELVKLGSYGVTLIPASQLVQKQKWDNRWNVPLYHVPKVVKK